MTRKNKKEHSNGCFFSGKNFFGLSEMQSMCNLGIAIENKGIEIAISPRTRLNPFMNT